MNEIAPEEYDSRENRTRLKELEAEVKKAAKRAGELQEEVLREHKRDGSILTKADLEINATLSEAILRLFPDANIVAEEQETAFVAERSWTFTIDPVDGTDAYSQGMPGWCVAVGIHNRELVPIGGIVSSPAWGLDAHTGLHIAHFPGDKVRAKKNFFAGHGPESTDGTGHDSGKETSGSREKKALMVGSKIHRLYDFSSYPGKIRSVGSSILHALSPLVYTDVAAAVLTPVYIWDISAAHGIIGPHGIDVVYPDGTPVSYDTLVHRQRSSDCLFIGDRKSREEISRHFIPRKKET